MNWILWNPSIETALVIIPEEAELLIPFHQKGKYLHTHLLTYAAPVTRGMLHFSNLDFYSIPPLPTNWKAPSWLTVELGILAGRVYFDYSEYGPICQYLGFTNSMTEIAANIVESEETSKEPKDNIDIDNVSQASNLSFTPKPLSFLQEWLALRRKGQEFSNTPMGYICQGKTLNERSPFFSSGRDIRVNIPKLKATDNSSDDCNLESPEASECEPENTEDQRRGQTGKRESFADDSSESEESDAIDDAGSSSEYYDARSDVESWGERVVTY